MINKKLKPAQRLNLTQMNRPKLNVEEPGHGAFCTEGKTCKVSFLPQSTTSSHSASQLIQQGPGW